MEAIAAPEPPKAEADKGKLAIGDTAKSPAAPEPLTKPSTSEPPKFASAGGHWNPAARQHGLDNPQGHHAGDMPNLTVAADGTGKLQYTLAGATLAGLLDADDSAFVVHAMRDDQKTDPSGMSGDRIACGVFKAG